MDALKGALSPPANDDKLLARGTALWEVIDLGVDSDLPAISVDIELFGGFSIKVFFMYHQGDGGWVDLYDGETSFRSFWPAKANDNELIDGEWVADWARALVKRKLGVG